MSDMVNCVCYNCNRRMDCTGEELCELCEADQSNVYNSLGQRVGIIYQGWLIKENLDEHKHMLHKPPAWGTDALHIDLLTTNDGNGIILRTRQGNTWSATLDDWVKHSFMEDRGAGMQRFLPHQYWDVKGPHGNDWRYQ